MDASAKGFAFVQLYAAYEFTVRGVVQAAIKLDNAHGHKMKEMAPSLLALYLDSELSALKDCGTRKVWDARLRIFSARFRMI